MSKLLEASEKEDPTQEGSKPPGLEDLKLPFERIILYIDDLDRCTPKRVVEVLEAVHPLDDLIQCVLAVDQRHHALVETVPLEKFVFGGGQNIDNGVADADHVIGRAGHGFL